MIMGEKFYLLEKCLNKLEIEFDKISIDKFIEYHELLKLENQKFNLTNIISEEDYIFKHVVDSVVLFKFFDLSGKVVVDIGTGAGFPGLPLKIINPSMKIIFIDSSVKKINFLRKVCERLEIEATFFSENIEIFGRNLGNREAYDVVLTRALARFSVLLEYGIPILKKRGKLICFKGPNSSEELEGSYFAMQKLEAIFEKEIDYFLPFTDYRRKIFVFSKENSTNSIYPRKPGIPRKKPLEIVSRETNK